MKTPIRVFLLIFGCLIAQIGLAQLAQKAIGVDTATGLSQTVTVWELNIKSRTKEVFIVYSVQTLAPTGKVVHDSGDNSTRRFNAPAVMDTLRIIVPANSQYDSLYLSPLGLGIRQELNTLIQKWPKIDQ